MPKSTNIDSSRAKTMTIWLNDDKLHSDVKHKAIDDNTTISNLTRKLYRGYVQGQIPAEVLKDD